MKGKLIALLICTFGLAATADASGFDIDLPKLVKQCNAGKAKACVSAGLVYARGEAVAYDVNKFRYFYQKACDLNSGKGCRLLGDAYRSDLLGKGEKNWGEAKRREAYKKSCNLGNASGCSSYASYVGSRKGALAMRQKACEMGSGYACYYIGSDYKANAFYHPDDFPVDDREAAKWYAKSCEFAFSEGCALMGDFYKQGRGGLGRDVVKANAYYDKGCELNSNDACYVLGTHYRDGKGIRSNSSRALELFEKACYLGNADSCYEAIRLHARRGAPGFRAKTGELADWACAFGSLSTCAKATRLR